MAGLGLVGLVEDDVYEANDITRHMVQMPSAQHGALHLYECSTWEFLDEASETDYFPF